jgi:hypothetical protein
MLSFHGKTPIGKTRCFVHVRLEVGTCIQIRLFPNQRGGVFGPCLFRVKLGIPGIGVALNDNVTRASIGLGLDMTSL